MGERREEMYQDKILLGGFSISRTLSRLLAQDASPLTCCSWEPTVDVRRGSSLCHFAPHISLVSEDFSFFSSKNILKDYESEVKEEVKVAQSDSCDPVDYIVHGILQARILEWVAFPFSRGSSQASDQTQVSCIAGGFFTSWATREAQENWGG